MTSHPIDLDRMRETAKKATPGVWKLWGMTVMADQDGTSNYDTAVEVAHTVCRDEHGKPRTWDAMHIATFDPPTVLALIERVDEARAYIAKTLDNVDGGDFTWENEEVVQVLNLVMDMLDGSTGR